MLFCYAAKVRMTLVLAFSYKILYLQPQIKKQASFNYLNTNYNKLQRSMTKADIVAEIAEKTGIEKVAVQATVESFMKSIKGSLSKGNNVYLRGFGSFIIKKRAEKTGRNILKNTSIIIPAHNVPAFKPAKTFSEKIKKTVK